MPHKYLSPFILLSISLFLFKSDLFCVQPQGHPDALFSVGGGYFFGGRRHSGGALQAEYRWNRYFFHCIRPQATLLIPELKGAFLGIGLGIECYLNNHFILIPSFEPGLYYKGKSRNLGYPIEFRSSIELAYESHYGIRLGAQFYHLSNAHLADHNPGANALMFYFAIPTYYIKTRQ